MGLLSIEGGMNGMWPARALSKSSLKTLLVELMDGITHGLGVAEPKERAIW
jgi:hypothetical protein